LEKALYGLKQAPRAWFARLSSKLQSMGFIPSRADTSLFILRDGSTMLFLLIYVDDIIVTGSSSLVVQRLLHSLSTAFAVKDLGVLHYFLGIQVTPVQDGIVLSQSQYIADILRRVGMMSCKGVTTPMASMEKLSLTDGAPLSVDDATKYRSTVGALQYVVLTRPDIAFSVNKVCQFLHSYQCALDGGEAYPSLS